MTQADFDAVVIGAGVVGLACGRALASRGQSVAVVDRAQGIGWEVSSRNSEVIHAGLYYATGSLKAQLCVEGRRRLYEYCDRHHVPYQKTGKWVVATSADELPALERIFKQAEINDVEGVRMLSQDEIKTGEPDLKAVAALLSEETGIIDSHSFMLSFQGEIEAAGGAFTPHTEVLAAERQGELWAVTCQCEGERFTVHTPTLINSAGLHASAVAKRIEGLDPSLIPAPIYARGNYYKLQGKSPFSRLIYPCPVKGGLGIHLTLDLTGSARFGPDVEWMDEIDFTVNPNRAEAFAQAIRRYWPALPDDVLVADYAGVRPKIAGPDGEPATDFRIDGPAQHGLPGLVNLLGIESPGLTSSLAIAERVYAMLEDKVPA